MVIKRVGALSLAKIAAVLYAGIGLLIGLVVALASLVWGSSFSGSGMPSFLGSVVGVGAIIILPICYGIIGFVGTLIAATIFNVAARITGGVEIEVQ